MTDRAVNAGVHAGVGFELQKHCALYIILERFHELKNKDYFLCIEHSDDLVFGFFDEESIQYIEAYQVKKSSTIWSINQKWKDIVCGILETGDKLAKGEFTKSVNYTHKLSFLSNQTTSLKTKVSDGSPKGKITIQRNIDETSSSVKFYSLPNEIHTKIEGELAIESQEIKDQLNNFFIEYIDLNRRANEQRNCLRGKCIEIFGNKIADPEAALDTLMKVFRRIELTFNQGNVTDMMDESKRLYSKDITYAIDLITTKSIAFDLWREQKRELAKGLNIPLSMQNDFETQFDNSIDYFKDLQQVEHKRILRFVEENVEMLNVYVDETDCIIALHDKYLSEHVCKLDDLVLKATVFAAFVRVRGLI